MKENPILCVEEEERDIVTYFGEQILLGIGERSTWMEKQSTALDRHSSSVRFCTVFVSLDKTLLFL